MKTFLKAIGLILIFAFTIFASAIIASAQEEARSFEEGQKVEIFCNCFGSNAWVEGKIESIGDSGYVVRYGGGTYQTKTVQFGSDRIRDPNQKPAAQNENQTNAPRKRRNQTNGNQNNSGNASSGGNGQTATASSGGFKVGDEVEVERWGNWVKGRIESIDERQYTIRVGAGTMDYTYVDLNKASQMKDPKKRAVEVVQDKLRRAFLEETKDFRPAVYAFLPFYEEELKPSYGFSPAQTDTERQAAITELAKLDALCKSKYAGMTDDLSGTFKDMIEERPAVWCDIAARRLELGKAGETAVVNARMDSFNQGFADSVEAAMKAYDSHVDEEVQLIVFERTRWLASLAANYPKVFAETGTQPTAETFAAVFAKADLLKAKIEREAPTRSWDAPLLHNAPLEVFVKNYYAKYLKGAQIVKIGMDMTDYRTFKNSLGIPTSQVIAGKALVKIANRPFCQSQVFELKKEYLGGGRYSAVKASYIGTAGTFVKCQ